MAPYSSRAKESAAVSMPITWRDVEEGIAPTAFGMGSGTMKKQLTKLDPWEHFWSKAKTLHRT